MDFLEAKRNRHRIPDCGKVDIFSTFDGAVIRYGLWPVEGEKGTVVLLGGRTDFIEVFYEDIYLWRARGYSVAVMDLRGQGLSHREHPDRDRQHITSFESHTKDLKCFFDQKLTGKLPAPFTLLGYSAGGLCAFDEKRKLLWQAIDDFMAI